MWNKWILWLGIIMLAVSCGTKWNRTDSEGLPHGPWVEYDQDSLFFAVLEYDHGQKVGQETVYYPDTSIYMQMHWGYDSSETYTELHGPYYHFRENGIPVMEGYYHYGQPDSVVKHYYPQGQVKTEGYYNEGTKTGVWVYYDLAGSKVKTIDYTDHPQPWQEDLQHGVYTYYAAGIQPAYRAEWFHETLIRDTILDSTSYGLLLQEGVIDTSQYLP